MPLNAAPSLEGHAPSTPAATDTYDSLKWRVDVVLHTKEKSSIQEPRAIVEIKSKHPDNLTFEMSRRQLSSVLGEFAKIQEHIQAYQGASNTKK
ncbi:Aste57867_11684 [Aphanomyces stellatus]|uniref:Aste57867_11684 protein n=1 Tax=Aphanomyces stellatus TaxID=120398 RepID=A0A485KU69_9STRA|nr:hypothetical protein As57867_011641 [Aphanomyces stellatus]VFT88541.1 Aste57867_11684 [Aphanomyces stellatus]